MASIRKTNTKWEARVRKKGFPTFCKSFTRKSDAIKWSTLIEVNLENGIMPLSKEQQQTTFEEAINRYLIEETAKKKGHASEKYRLQKLMGSFLGKKKLKDIKPSMLATFRDKRSLHVKSASVRKEIYLISAIFEKAQKEWGMEELNNPVRYIKIPRDSSPRIQRLTSEEKLRLLSGLRDNPNRNLEHISIFALETAMRRSEILQLRWEDIDFQRSLATLNETKNGQSRIVPLSKIALDVITKREKETLFIFNISSNAVRLAWSQFQKRYDFKYFRFHDLRHEAISNLFDMGLNIPEASLISGHRTPTQLLKYSHANISNLVNRLNT